MKSVVVVLAPDGTAFIGVSGKQARQRERADERASDGVRESVRAGARVELDAVQWHTAKG